MMDNEKKNDLCVCKYCNQFMMCDEGECAEDLCLCDGAVRERNRRQAVANLLSAVDACCGEGCNAEFPDFEPVAHDIMILAHELVEQISKYNLVKATLDLGDNTRLVMNCEKVIRRRVAVAESRP